MKDDRQEKLKISNDLLDAMLVGVKTQEDLWGKEGLITQISTLITLKQDGARAIAGTAMARKLSGATSAPSNC